MSLLEKRWMNSLPNRAAYLLVLRDTSSKWKKERHEGLKKLRSLVVSKRDLLEHDKLL